MYVSWDNPIGHQNSYMDQKLIAAILMGLLSLSCIAVILRGLKLGLRRTGWDAPVQRSIFRKTGYLIGIWVVLMGVLASAGFFSDFTKMPPRPGLVVLLPLPVILVIAFSKKGSELLQVIPPYWLIAVQSFRILVELLLLRAFLQNLLPVQMTFEGYNFDVLSGLLAIPAALIIKNKRWPGVSLAYNIIGLLLLINIIMVAILSMPTPLRYFMNEPANTLVGEFPFIYLPGVLVVAAYSLHIFSLRQWWLLKKK